MNDELRKAAGTAVDVWDDTGTRHEDVVKAMNDLRKVLAKNANAAPFDFHAHLARQAAWSVKTFGPGDRAQGVVDHIRKELREIEQAPGDLEEWIDVVILALDGAWRSGATPEQIIAAIVAKQTKNESRTWPDWRTADPDKAIEHVRGDRPCYKCGSHYCDLSCPDRAKNANAAPQPTREAIFAAVARGWCAKMNEHKTMDADLASAVADEIIKLYGEGNPDLQTIEQYRLQMAGISVAAIGYWKEGDVIHPDYDTPALRDVAKLYAKYDELYKVRNVAPQDQDAHEAKAMTRRIVDGYLITESDTRVTARPITDADRYAFLKTMSHHQIDRVMYSRPENWDAIIDNLMKEQK